MAEIGALTGASAILNSIRLGRGSDALRQQAQEQSAERLRAKKNSSESLRDTRITNQLFDKQAISRLLVDKQIADIDQELIDSASQTFSGPKGASTTHTYSLTRKS